MHFYKYFQYQKCQNIEMRNFSLQKGHIYPLAEKKVHSNIHSNKVNTTCNDNNTLNSPLVNLCWE